jgi:hypothetical protein
MGSQSNAEDGTSCAAELSASRGPKGAQQTGRVCGGSRLPLLLEHTGKVQRTLWRQGVRILLDDESRAPDLTTRSGWRCTRGPDEAVFRTANAVGQPTGIPIGDAVGRPIPFRPDRHGRVLVGLLPIG